MSFFIKAVAQWFTRTVNIPTVWDSLTITWDDHHVSWNSVKFDDWKDITSGDWYTNDQ
jgi:hypothetical protein